MVVLLGEVGIMEELGDGGMAFEDFGISPPDLVDVGLL